MSTTALNGLRDYLIGTLSPDNMIWLATQLTEYAKKQQEPPFRRYTMDEINAMLDEAEANFAAGRGIPDEEAWGDLNEEMALLENEQHEMAEAI